MIATSVPRRTFLILALIAGGILALLVVPSLPGVRGHGSPPKSPTPIVDTTTFAQLQSAFATLTPPTEASLIYTRYSGCQKCQYGDGVFVYATDLSPQDVSSYYQRELKATGWTLIGAMSLQLNRHETWTVEAQWTFPAAYSQVQSLYLYAAWSKDVLDQEFLTKQVTAKAKASGVTVYCVLVAYTQDVGVRERLCPPGVAACINEWWKREEFAEPYP